MAFTSVSSHMHKSKLTAIAHKITMYDKSFLREANKKNTSVYSGCLK